jgi:hypothetical protein
MSAITLLTDDFGLQREYTEVKREANVGDRIKITDANPQNETPYENGAIFTVHKLAPLFWGDFYTECDRYIEAKEYVVLEATDTIRIDGARYRVVEREARAGDMVLHTSSWANKRGNVSKCILVYEDNSGISAEGTPLFHKEYIVLEPLTTTQLSAKPAEEQCAEIIANLSARVSQLETQVTALQERTYSGKFNVEIEGNVIARNVDAKITMAIPQFTRKEIIKRAKADIVELSVWFLDAGARSVKDVCNFVVNREKRTIVALIREIDGGVIYRGKARCAPDDVFNVHIGKIIALRRALGLAVPDEYVHAPKPTDVNVGDIVVRRNGTLFANLNARALVKTVYQNGEVHFDTGTFLEAYKLTVVDDSGTCAKSAHALDTEVDV